jgi:hypothetical protein
MGKIIMVEALIATPPTSKCQETVNTLEELIRWYPEETRLVVFRRGIDFMPEEFRLESHDSKIDTTHKQASLQMRQLIQKGTAVPSVVIDGVIFCSVEVPVLEKLKGRVQEVLLSARG